MLTLERVLEEQKNLNRLCADRPQSTVEIYPPNDFYGHATILKQYSKIPSGYQIKASIEHGIYFNDWAWNVDLRANLPAIFTSSKYRLKILKSKTAKALFAIGPILHYAPHYLNESSLNNEKKRIGENLLVFAGHSTHWVDCNYDIEKLCQLIKEIGKDFDTIRICLYWKDVLRGHAEYYLKEGFECVTAGHMFDPLFLPRLKSIIELATLTASNILGTHIGYCILMGKPHYYYEDQPEYTAQSAQILETDVAESSPKIVKAFRAFSKFIDNITPLQKEIVEKYWGIGEEKSVQEMQSIFQTAEDMYKKGCIFYMSNRDVLTEQAVDYLNHNKNKEALFLLENAIKINPEVPGLLYAKAVALTKLGKTDEAIEILKNLLAAMPEHKEAQLLLNELNQINPILQIDHSTFQCNKNFYGQVILNHRTQARRSAFAKTIVILKCWVRRLIQLF